MLKDVGYQEKIVMLKQWMPLIVEVVRKDLKNEHLKIDPAFCRRYFLGKDPSRLSGEEMAQAYSQDIAEGNVGLGEFIASRWLLKNTDVYGFFEEKLKSLTDHFESIEELEEGFSFSLMQEAVNQFGATKTYLFSVFNSVVFPQSVYDRLQALAREEAESTMQKKETEEESRSLEALKKGHERKLASLIDKYEKKLSGLQKKYLHDVGILKKQVGELQKKLAEKNA